MIFILEWILKSVVFLFCMTINNLVWITGSGSEWEQFKANQFPITNRDGCFISRWDYAWRGRICSVWSNWRDISTAIVGGLILCSFR